MKGLGCHPRAKKKQVQKVFKKIQWGGRLKRLPQIKRNALAKERHKPRFLIGRGETTFKHPQGTSNCKKKKEK